MHCFTRFVFKKIGAGPGNQERDTLAGQQRDSGTLSITNHQKTKKKTQKRQQIQVQHKIEIFCIHIVLQL